VKLITWTQFGINPNTSKNDAWGFLIVLGTEVLVHMTKCSSKVQFGEMSWG
jgi:hypothetical protein